MSKWVNAAKGIVLAASKVKRFNTDIFAGKRVAVVGPASSAFNTDRGDYIDGFDLVVRMNKSPFIVAGGLHAKDIGVKTNVLFHCFHENPVGGGGPIDFALYKRIGVEYVVNPRNEWSGVRNTFNYYKKYLEAQKTYLLPKVLFNEISNSVGAYRPTTGYSALYTLLKSDFKELYVTGFTFFKTAYGQGYRDEMREAPQAQQFIRDVGLHNPDLELQGFKKVLSERHVGNIILDRQLADIVARY